MTRQRKLPNRFLVSVLHGYRIFGRPARHEDDDVSLGGSVHDRQFAPLLNGVLHGADRIATFGKQVGIKLISVIGSYVHIARIRKSARKRQYLDWTQPGRKPRPELS
jgi:hypothetical protein